MKLLKFGKSKIVLAVAIIYMLISMIGTSFMQNNWGKSDVSVYTGSLTSVADMIRENNKKFNKDIQVTFDESKTAQFSFMTIKPDNASNENPVPAVVCIHGGSNSKEMQLNVYTELARRGFVVISMDMAGHGYSDNAVDALTHGSLGAEAAIEYAMSLGYVDETQVGVTGHSTGGNSSVFGTMAINTPESKQRVAALIPQCGTMGVSKLTPEVLEGVVTTIGVSYYDEFDTVYFDSNNILTNKHGRAFIQNVYSKFNDDAVIDGQWYTQDGKIDAPKAGEAIKADTAIRLCNPKITHPMFHFTTTGTQIVLDGMYAAFGTPSGATYISTDSQTWPIMVAFELLGLIGFFMMMFPVVSLLADTRVFAGIRRKEVELSDSSSIKNPIEIIITLVTIAALTFISLTTFVKYFPLGASMVNPETFPARGTVGNGVGIWTIISGIVLLIAIVLGYFCRKILYKKDISNPFETGKLDSVSQFLLTMLFAFTVVSIMFIPVYIARYVFAADFRICSFMIMAPEINQLPIILISYLPMWLLFYVPNAIFNANTRYKDAPDWITTVICAVANCLSMIIFIIIQYTSLYKTGSLWNPDAGMAGIVAFAVAPCLAFAAFSARYIYKKTGNAWAAGAINALIMCIITIFPNGMATDLTFPF